MCRGRQRCQGFLIDPDYISYLKKILTIMCVLTFPVASIVSFSATISSQYFSTIDSGFWLKLGLPWYCCSPFPSWYTGNHFIYMRPSNNVMDVGDRLVTNTTATKLTNDFSSNHIEIVIDSKRNVSVMRWPLADFINYDFINADFINALCIFLVTRSVTH